MTPTQDHLRFPMKTQAFSDLRQKLLDAANSFDWECACGHQEKLSRLPDRFRFDEGRTVECPKCGKRGQA